MRRLMSITTISLCGVVVGCGLGSDPADPPAQQPDSGPGYSDGMGQKRVAAPTVDQLPESVCGTSVPVRGTAAPGVSVFAVGGLETSGIATDANPANGRFCMPVRLKAGAVNTIEVRAQDPVLGISEPRTVTVKQSSCTDDGQPPIDQPKPQNVALGIKARASKSPDEGNEGFLTDGNTKTVVKYSGGWGFGAFGWIDANVWVTVKLPKVTEIGSIVVKWRDSEGSGSDYGSDYKVLVSAMSDPGDPNLKNGYWSEVKTYQSGSGGTNSIDLTNTKPVAQHVALWLYHDGGNGWSESFALSELEVWDSPKKVTSTPIAQQTGCETGN